MTRRISGLLHGDYSGLLHRSGSELGDTRRYVEGDDVRRIDWPATARTNETQVHDTIADHELDVWLVVDTSPSMAFGTARSTKFRVAADAAGAIGHLVVQSGNRVGCALSGADLVVPPRAGLDQLSAVLAAIERAAANDADATARNDRPDDMLAVPMSSRTRRGLVVVVSDFFGAGWDAALGRLSRRHDVIALVVTDPREFELPDVGVVDFEDAETGAVVGVDTSRPDVREKFAEETRRRFEGRVAGLRSARADVVELRTDADWVSALAGFLRSRRGRLAAGSR